MVCLRRALGNLSKTQSFSLKTKDFLCLFAAARLLGMGDYTSFHTKIQFAGGLPIDEEAQMQVHEMELKNRIKSRRTVMQERGIVDVDAEMLRIEEESASEQA